jgi:rubrerythrin
MIFQKAVETLQLASELELIVGKLYETFSLYDGPNKLFWLDISKQEEEHSKSAVRLMQMVKNKPEEFSDNRIIKPEVVKSIMKDVENSRILAKDGALPVFKFLFVARDIENSILEQKYNEIVRSSNLEFKKLVDGIIKDTIIHREMLDKKIIEGKREFLK